MPATNPGYRNNRSNFYTDKAPDSLNIGSVIQVLKSTSTKAFDANFIPAASPINGTNSYKNDSGDANLSDNPDFQYRGYLYCDGSEYNIKDYPALYEIIGTSYGGESNNGVTMTSGGILTVTRTGTAAAGTASYNNVVYTTTSSGTGAAFNVSRSGGVYTVTVASIGSGYSVSNTFTVLGTALGGTSPANNLTITVATVASAGGSGYPSNTTVTFSAAPTGGTTATGTPIISSGVITGVSIINYGSGYVTPPTVTFTGTGGTGATATVRINSLGEIAPVNQNTVFSIWPDANMGTFRVPDFKAKKLVGNGPVYGSGTPTIGLSELEVGLNSIGGKWYLDKTSQKGQFSLGKVSTTGYEKVTDSISSKLIGSQTITVAMDEKRLQGMASHTHQLLHCQASKDQSFAARPYGDRYLVSYDNGTGKINSFLPSGGLALSHKHALVKRPITANTVATYDIYNYTGGDSGTGSLKTASSYYASGDSSGTYELVTSTTPTLFKKFNSSSVIGGRVVTTAGTPTYSFVTYDYTTPQTNTTLSIPANADILQLQVYGASGSGAAYSVAGNAGTASSVRVGDGSLLTVTAPGGGGGGAASLTTGGTAGTSGVSSVTGSSASSYTSTTTAGTNNAASVSGGIYTPGFATAGTALSGGPFYKTANSTNPPEASGIRGSNGYAVGSDGKNISVTSVLAYPGTTYTTDSTATVSGGTNAVITKIELDIYGGSGANCGNFGGNYSTGVGSYDFSLSGCTTGKGIPGKRMKVSVNSPTTNNTFLISPGPAGGGGGREGGTSNGGNGTYGDGGTGGDGYGSNDGGGGGATTVVRLSNGTLIAGAGGGGGGGGAGEGQCGQDGQVNVQFGDSPQGVAQEIFSGTGAAGGNYGCTGGGGGGGGGGIGTAAQSVAAGGSGGGGGGFGDHGSGDGGRRGLSTYRTDFVTLVNSGDGTLGQAGRVVVSYELDNSYWSPGGGGGGRGGVNVGSISLSNLPGQSSVTVNVGTGGAGVTYTGGTSSSGTNPVTTTTSSTVSSNNGGNGYVQVRFATITGYVGGTTSTTVGDIIKFAPSGVEIYTPGSGSGTSGGFTLPTTQAPVVVFEGGGGGSGAAATATVTSGVVSGITLTSGGSGYTTAPIVRILHGAGSGTTATATISGGVVTGVNLTANSSTTYTHYVKFGGTAQTRYVITNAVDCTNVKRFGIKAARGNGINGGDRPENGGDELVVYYNTDGTNNFPEANYLGVMTPIPSDTDISTNYDGTSGSTRWYSYFIDLAEAQQLPGVQFKISQNRPAASGANDSGSDSDHYGICDIVYEYKAATVLTFIPSAGALNSSADLLTYVVEGPANATYTTGMSANDVTFTLSSGTPLVPVASINPNINIPLLEPYILVKHMIKAF